MSSSSKANGDEALLVQINRQNMTHYEILGVATTASGNDIKRSYKQLALKFHPDKYAGPNKTQATSAFQKINTAYQVLSDPSQKRVYDESLRNGSFNSSGAASASSTDTAAGAAAGIAVAATVFTGLLTAFMGSAKETAERFSQEDELQNYIKSMTTFLQVVKEELDITDEFIMQSGAVIMKAFADVFVDILPFLIGAARQTNPSLVWKLSAIATIGAFFAKDEVFKIFDWKNMNAPTRSLVVDGLLYYYQNKMK
jgi:hypothetical protein